jgi:hypothetical protein
MADYYSVISSAVSNLPGKTIETRWELYDRACDALQEKLLALDPPISEDELANEQFALETAIRRVEEDLLLDIMNIMRRFVKEDAPRAAPSVTLISTVRELARSMENKLHNAITIVRDRLRSSEATKVVIPIKENVIACSAQSLVFVQETQLQMKTIGRRIYLSILVRTLSRQEASSETNNFLCGSRNFIQNLRSSFSAFRPLMLFVAGKRIFQTFCEKKSNRKVIGIGYLFGLTHHNIFGLSNGHRQLLGQAKKRLLSLLFEQHIKFDNSFSDTIEMQ